MLSDDLKGGKFLVTCYQVISVLSDLSLKTDTMTIVTWSGN